jgi:hypothetical protein
VNGVTVSTKYLHRPRQASTTSEEALSSTVFEPSSFQTQARIFTPKDISLGWMSGFKRKGGAIFQTSNHMTLYPISKNALLRVLCTAIASLLQRKPPPLGSLAGEQSFWFSCFLTHSNRTAVPVGSIYDGKSGILLFLAHSTRTPSRSASLFIMTLI